MTKTEIREMLRHAISKTSVVGDELYYPARWRFGDGARGASTSEPLMRHIRTPRQAKVMLATAVVSERLGAAVEFIDPCYATIANAVQLIHDALKGDA